MTKIALLSTPKCHEEDDDVLPPPQERYAGEIWLSSQERRPVNTRGVLVSLDGRADSPLDWSAEIAQAKILMSEGLNILWKLDLGLFHSLTHPLTDERQLRTLQLSLEHFRETIWDQFSSQTIALQIYEGDLAFMSSDDACLDETVPFSEWVDSHQADHLNPKTARLYYKRDVAAEYICHLTAALPEELRILMQIKVSNETPLSLVLALLNPDRFEKVEWVLDSQHPLHSTWLQKGDLLIPQHSAKSSTGFCIPFPEWMPEVEAVLESLLQKHPNLRLIPEGGIISQWDQLDELYVLEQQLTPFGRRQLQGFVAAGGTVHRIVQQQGILQQPQQHSIAGHLQHEIL